jgi:hypothetical protein
LGEISIYHPVRPSLENLCLHKRNPVLADGENKSVPCAKHPTPSTALRHRENWVSQGFLSDECDSCISPENWGFDVRWVRFPKHILFFPTLSQLEFVGSWNSYNWVQRVVRELVVETTV